MSDNGQDDFVVQALQAAKASEAPPEADSRMRQHLETLRSRLADGAIAPATSSRPRAGRRRFVAWLAAASLAAVLTAGALVFWPEQASQAQAQVLAAAREQTWLHAVCKADDGVIEEWWCSPHFGISAVRNTGSSMFTNYRLSTIDLYEESEATLLRIPLDERRRHATQGHLLAGLFMANPQSRQSKFVVGGLTIQFKSEEFVSDRIGQWMEDHFDVDEAGERVGEVTLQSDPHTHLPWACTLVLHRPGTNRVGTRFDIDFPTTGPGSIYALGAPQSAKFVDRTERGNERKLVEGNAAAGHRFDKYYGIVVQTGGSSAWSDAMSVHRVWRSGDRWRIENNYGPLTGEKVVAHDVDRKTWWLDRAARHPFLPVSISDGKSVCTFSTTEVAQVTPKIPGLPMHNPKKPDVAAIHSIQKSVSDFSVFGLGAISTYLPDLQTHPYIPIDPKMHPYTVTVNDNPADAPKGTVLLELRSAIGTLQYWIDVQHDYLVTQFTTDAKGLNNKSTWTVDDMALSPQGNWYPTVVCFKGASRNVHNDEREDYLHTYYLDFDAEIPDSLFEWSGPDFRKTVLDHAQHLMGEDILPPHTK
jgi:hypothetical protein